MGYERKLAFGYEVGGVRIDVDDYGGGFANYTPPTGAEGMMVVAIDTNSTTPGKRLYIYANGEWTYVTLGGGGT